MKLALLSVTTLLLAVSCNKPAADAESSAQTAAEATVANPYPLDTCLVSGEKLGSMGDPVSLVHEGQEIKFCCDHCIPKFEKDPAKYLSMLAEKTK